MLLEEFLPDDWLIHWRNPAVDDGSMEVGVDVGDDLLPAEPEADRWLEESLAVLWLSGDEAEEVRQRYFGGEPPPPLRRIIVRGTKRLFRQGDPEDR